MVWCGFAVNDEFLEWDDVVVDEISSGEEYVCFVCLSAVVFDELFEDRDGFREVRGDFEHVLFVFFDVAYCFFDGDDACAVLFEFFNDVLADVRCVEVGLESCVYEADVFAVVCSAE